MSASTSLAIRIATIFDNKGLKKANKDVNKLQSAVKKLAGAAGIGLSIAAVVKFGKNAVKAFAENEKSAKRLEGVVKNLGLALSNPLIESNLDSISKKYGYQGEVLRESYQKLLTSTGSLEKSQDLLNLSLDIAAGTGQDLVSVNQDLAALYVGNTKGLKKYNLGLSAAQLKTIKYEDAVSLLNKQFAGAAQSELGTYSGKMRILGEAAGNAEEIIGGGLIDALMILTGDTSIDGLAKSMNEFAENAVTATTQIATLIEKITGTPIAKAAGTMLGDLLTGQNYGQIFGLTPYGDTNTKGGRTRVRPRANRLFAGGQDSILEAKRNKEIRAAEAEALKRAKALAAAQAKILAEAKKKVALDKASKTLNLQAIGIEAALKGKISETDRISLLLQKAILEGNASLATQLSDKLEEIIKRNEQLRLALLSTPKAPNPFEDWKIPTLTMPELNLGNISSVYARGQRPNQGGGFDFFDPAKVGMTSGGTPPINIKVEIAGEAVEAVITNSQINSSLSGSFNQVNRSGNVGAVAIQ